MNEVFINKVVNRLVKDTELTTHPNSGFIMIKKLPYYSPMGLRYSDRLRRLDDIAITNDFWQTVCGLFGLTDKESVTVFINWKRRVRELKSVYRKRIPY
jgi:hypothetical protein